MAGGMERAIVVATPEALEPGERLGILPPNLRMMGWFDFSENHLPMLDRLVTNAFDEKDVLQDVSLRRRVWGERTRIAHGVERGQWYAVHALARSLGKLDTSDENFKKIVPKFLPLGGEKPARGPISFASVALVSSRHGGVNPLEVVTVARPGVPQRVEATT